MPPYHYKSTVVRWTSCLTRSKNRSLDLVKAWVGIYDYILLSTWLQWIMPSTHRYVHIGMYIPTYYSFPFRSRGPFLFCRSCTLFSCSVWSLNLLTCCSFHFVKKFWNCSTCFRYYVKSSAGGSVTAPFLAWITLTVACYKPLCLSFLPKIECSVCKERAGYTSILSRVS